jgi:hypothetical protein
MSSSHGSGEDAPMEVVSHDGGTPEDAAAATAASEELIATLIARLMPNLERLIISSVGGQLQPLPPPAENASSTLAQASPAPSVSSSRPEAALMDPLRQPTTTVSLDPSDPEVELRGLQRDLSAAVDTFHLDHLDDGESFPTYDATQEPEPGKQKFARRGAFSRSVSASENHSRGHSR